MAIDVAARVVANRALSTDYNVLALAAPELAATAAPGQFVMIKAGRGHDPLLRRPFSVFEVLRDEHGTPTGISILNKRIGVSTGLVYDARSRDSASTVSDRSDVRSRSSSRRARRWMVAGGVGLAPFAELAAALRARGVTTVLFYGARSGAELFYLDFFRDLGVELVLTTEDGSLGERGRIVAPLDRRLAARPADSAVMVYACGPEGHARGDRQDRRATRPAVPGIGRTNHGLRSRRLLQLRRADANRRRRFHHVRSCIAGPVLAGGSDSMGVHGVEPQTQTASRRRWTFPFASVR